MQQDSYVRKGIVVNVVDGDTVDVRVDLGFHVAITERFRLLRIDTPEIVGTERAEGLKAKEYVKDLMLNREVVIQSFKTDGFRRWLAEIWFMDNGTEVNLSDRLLELGLAKPF